MILRRAGGICLVLGLLAAGLMWFAMQSAQNGGARRSKWLIGEPWYNQPIWWQPGDLNWPRKFTVQEMDPYKLKFVTKPYRGPHAEELQQMYNVSSGEVSFRTWLKYAHPEIAPFYVGADDDTFKWGTAVLIGGAVVAAVGLLTLLATRSRDINPRATGLLRSAIKKSHTRRM